MENISGFALGHIDVIFGEKTISSRNKIPDQSMMLFVTVTDLLDGYRKFYLSSKIEEYTCIGADSSFSISFKKANGNNISVEVGGEFLCEVNKNLLAKSIFEASSNFINRYINKLSKDDPVVEDLITSFSHFREFYSTII
ncbi:hypothetical protein CTHBC1_1919 [Acetivibrio thermocellus BC1]|uniref:hypothetical protein n=1 Tax=Acetivibrio thermocellus TaxID=1515 RepID=UPI0003B85ABE|nr:hypothetical protein [Acetivibrio thermocellus]THJ76520.1 hypothetical protein EPD62_16175 [Acetivibrio thermocellus]CDG36526.1 hypothetical protein CTHBC1_1919 [Acetivibrio thermocellus BC1]